MNNLNQCTMCTPQTNKTINIKNTSQINYIIETVRNIDKMQKEIAQETGCTGCNDLLISSQTLYNTKPVIFRFGNGEAFSAVVGVDGATTTTFRIQDLKGTVAVLRLLTYDTTTSEYTCTNYTVLLDLKCICSLQCLAPINCPCCTNSLTV